MLFLVKFIGIVTFAMGIAFLLEINFFKQVMVFWKNDKNLYLGSVLKIVFSLIFILGSFDPDCKMKTFILAVGVLGVIAGSLVFALGLEKSKEMMKWWDKRGPAGQKALAIISIAFGVLVIYAS